MDPLSDAEIDDYLATGQWEGKAGAFGYQDRLGLGAYRIGERVERGGTADGDAGGDVGGGCVATAKPQALG